MKLEMFQVDAFTDRVFSGNSAAVVLLDDWLPDAVLQGIALENNLAETAFLKPQGEQWEIRWFTPTDEVPFCGHATLASACALHLRKGIDRAMRFTTRQVGDLIVTPQRGSYRMDIPRFDPDFDIPEDALVNSLLTDAWIKIFRNRENFFAELATEADVLAFRPDLPRIAELGSLGLHHGTRRDERFRFALFRAWSRYSRRSGDRLDPRHACPLLGAEARQDAADRAPAFLARRHARLRDCSRARLSPRRRRDFHGRADIHSIGHPTASASG